MEEKKEIMQSQPEENIKEFLTDKPPEKEEATFEDCELAILRHAIEENEIIQAKKLVNDETVKKIIDILEKFLIETKNICYGGTAINNILPKEAQFYNRDLEIPDYDFYSPTAMEHAIQLADIYYANGYKNVEAKSGVHHGTFKVFVNNIGIADITELNEQIYKEMSKETVVIDGISYAPPNFLRMAMYLELSRPEGDVSRWEKVYKRLSLLNKYYPTIHNSDCKAVDFESSPHPHMNNYEKIYYTIRDEFIRQGVIFLGGYADVLYSKYMSNKASELINKIPDFDVLTENPEESSDLLIKTLTENGFTNIEKVKHEQIGELIPQHIEVLVNGEVFSYIYKPIACHNYNIVDIDKKEVKIATIDTMLSFYLAFYYSGEPYYNKNRILCMSQYLFEVQETNKTQNKGILKRFNIDCVGKQPTLESIREEKSKKYEELKNKRNTREYDHWFLKYNPVEKEIKNLKMQQKIKIQEMANPPVKAVGGKKMRKNKTQKRVHMKNQKKHNNRSKRQRI